MPKNGSFEVLFVLTVIFLYFFQTYLLADEDVGGRKSQKAKELGFVFTSTFLLY